MINFIPYVFNISEIISNFKDEKQLNNWLYSRLKSKKIKKVRNGLYVYLDQNGYVTSSKFEIASKINKDVYLSYHSALEYYGFANQVFNNVIISSKYRFNNFEFNGIEYVNKVNANYIEVNKDIGTNIKVTSIERTIIDCIDNINLAGGIEEVLNALEQIKHLDEIKLLNVLESYNKVLLYQKVGYILEQYKEQLGLSNNFFIQCKNKLTNQIKYFLSDEYKNIGYSPDWKLMAPMNLKSIINGGL